MSDLTHETKNWMLRSRYMGGAATALALLATSNAGLAQDAEAETTEFDEIVVTGSRIVRKDLQSVSPLTVTSAEEVKFSGHHRLEDLMNNMPQLSGSTASSSYLGNGSTGIASLDLRGLGVNRTLVLVNGRRLQPGGIYSNAADINQIPSGLVKQVEVLTGGASATYGADAVAGVVNFVIDQDFEGIKLNAGISGYQHNNRNKFMQGILDDRNFDYPKGSTFDGGQYNFDIAMGSSFADGKGHVSAYINYRTTTELKQQARDYSSCSLSSASTCGGSGNAIIPNFDVYPIDPVTGETSYASDTNRWVTLDPNSNIIDSVGNVYNYAPVNHYQRPDKRYAAGAYLNYEFNENLRPYMEIMYAKDVTTGQYAESGTFFDEEYKVKCSSPLLNDAQRADICGGYGLTGDQEFAVYVGKRNVEGGPRKNNLTHSSIRFVIGMDGQVNDNWRYDASLTYGSTNSSNTYENDFFAPNITRALDVVLDANGNKVCASGEAGCVPYEIFTYQGVTPEQANTLTATAIVNGQTQMTVANAYVTGDLPVAIADDPIQAVFGVEYRKEQYERISDNIFELGQLLGLGGAQPSIRGQYDVKELFGEVVVPLVQDADFAQALTMELAYRYSDYSTTGGASTYKAGLTWQVNDMIKFRGGYNRASRAPNVRELFIPQNRGLWSGTDVCAGASPIATAAQCANTGVTADQYGNVSVSPAGQYNQLSGGNPDLKQETGDTFTFGLVASPVPGMSIAVDYWDIKISDLISNITPELANTQCAETGNAAFCDLVTRSPSGSLWLGSQGSVLATNQNLGFTQKRGIDVDANYAMDLGDGQLRFRFLSTYLLKDFTQEIPDYAPSEYGCVGQLNGNCYPASEWRHTLSANYDSGDFWTVGLKWRYFSAVTNNESTNNHKDIAAQSYVDLSAGFEITENVSLAVGINNIFDKEPPLVNDRYDFTNGNTFPAIYDPLGRRLFLTVSAHF